MLILNPIIIAGLQPGGQLTTTTDVDNWPGEENGVQGPDLMQKLQNQVERFKAKIISDHISEANLEVRPFILKGMNTEYTCDSLIIATGASAKYLGLPSEKLFMGRGVSACATCDGFFYKDQDVAVVGGGNTAVEEALYLSNIAKSVTLIHRRDKLKSEKILIDQIMNKASHGNITILWNTKLNEICGDNTKGVTHLNLSSIIDNSEKSIKVTGVFIAIGHTPNTQIFKNQLKMNSDYIILR